MVDRLDEISYETFFQEYLLKNKPCLFRSNLTNTWKCRREWVKEDGKPNLDYLAEHFGSADVPVANCDLRTYNSQCKENMKFTDYVLYWKRKSHTDHMPSLYLKDWHFQKQFASYTAYVTPKYFSSDWLNEFCSIGSDDYRFVYMGPGGTWTPLHADVFGSYSWSANICGTKRWLLFPPGTEKHLASKNQLPYSVEEVEDKISLGINIIQGSGEIIFVPSGWYHQVWNLEDCISINHNWFNGCNIEHIWKCLLNESIKVEHEIADCKDSPDWVELCQQLLKIHHGMNYEEFVKLLEFILSSRLKHILDLLQQAITSWDIHQSSVKYRIHVPDFVKVNSDALREGGKTPRQLMEFRKEHSYQPKYYYKEYQKVNLVKVPDMVFGDRIRDTEDIVPIITNAFQKLNIEQLKIVEAKRRARLQSEKAVMKQPRKIELLREQMTHKKPVEATPLWKMSPFSNVKPRINSLRSTCDREECALKEPIN